MTIAAAGSNLTIRILYGTLLALMATLKDGQALPRTLYLQMDKCSRYDRGNPIL